MAYTARQIYLAALTETNKTGAPSLLLSDYNYFINKAINLYVNEHYNIYDISLQTTDDLRVLKSTVYLKVKNVNFKPMIDGEIVDLNKLGAGLSKMFAGTYEVILPLDYLHVLNCKCIFELLSDYECWDKGNYIDFAAERVTSDAKSLINSNPYLTPKPWRPYYCIHNVNVTDKVSTNPRNKEHNPYGTDYTTSFKTDYSSIELKPTEGDDKTNVAEIKGIITESEELTDNDKENNKNSEFKRTVTIKNIYNNGKEEELDIVNVKPAGLRLGNSTGIRCELLCGKDDSVFKLKFVEIDYIKAPLHVRLTLELIDLIKDTSLMMEFPDYVCLEIINKLILLLMENQGNQRLQTHPLVSLSINYLNNAAQTQQALQLAQQLAARRQ